MAEITLNDAQVETLQLLAKKAAWTPKSECIVDGTAVHGMTINALEKRKLITTKDTPQGIQCKILQRGVKALKNME